MRRRAVLIIILALAAGAVAAYLAFRFVGQPSEPEGEEAEAPRVDVAVAAADMPAGAVVSPDDVKLVGWPAGALPAGYISEPADAVGRGLLTSVRANEPFLEGKLASAEAGGGLPIIIPEGKRAVSVAVDQVIGVAGFVLPGTRVDVIATVTPPTPEGTVSGAPEAESQIVIENVDVLSAGQSYERQVEGEPLTVSVVTLLVTPEQAEKLALATQQGSIQLALRNPLDLGEVPTMGVTVTGLVREGGRRGVQEEAAPVGPPPLLVEIYRGPQRDSAVVDTTVLEGGER